MHVSVHHGRIKVSKVLQRNALSVVWANVFAWVLRHATAGGVQMRMLNLASHRSITELNKNHPTRLVNETLIRYLKKEKS